MFRESCRAFLAFSNSQSDTDPEHFECGRSCPNCPARAEREAFEEALRENLTQKTGERWKDYGLDNLLQTVVDISDLAETPQSNWTIKTERLVRILTSERRRLERIERWNNRRPEN